MPAPPPVAGSGGKRGWPPALRLGLAVSLAAVAALPFFPRRRGLLAALLLAGHGLLAAAGLTPRSHLLGPNLTRLGPAARRRREVALTFDDGPDPEVTPAVLDQLQRRGARATFFCIGRRVEEHPGLAAEIAGRGHRVENHTQRHLHGFALLGAAAQGREIDRAQDAIGAACGRRPRFFRAPAGIRNPFLDPVLARRGLHLVSWTRRGFDAVDDAADRVLRRLVRGLAAGDVLVLHDGSTIGRPGRRAPVLRVLPPLLDVLADRGLRPVSLDPEHIREPGA